MPERVVKAIPSIAAPARRLPPGAWTVIRAAQIRGLTRPAVLWVGALVVSICFEGLGRKFLPEVPAIVFYFLKDAVLLIGLLRFGIRRSVQRGARRAFRGFGPILGLAMAWTLIEALNGAQNSPILALVGLRSYWLWWLAPLVIASALRVQEDREYGVMLLAIVALVVAGTAALQFSAPADASINTYALYEGREMNEVATVSATGRVRVSSTFSYLSGFVDFVILAPALLLSLGLEDRSRLTRWLCLAAAGATAATMPMSGSRWPVLMGVAALLAVVWGAGFVRTHVGRRVLIAAVLVLGAAAVAVPEATEGVRSRFEGRDTQSRIVEGLMILPPIALAYGTYPMLGIGTGMQQNARVALRVRTEWDSEAEPARLLIELGPVGYLLVWLARLGLLVALLRVARQFKHEGRRALSGAALAYALLTMMGNLFFDHVWQALYFTGAGLILQAASDGGKAEPVSAGSPLAISHTR